MLSAAYMQSYRNDAAGSTKDPDNELLWRMNRRRLDVEAWRDAVLAVAGELDLKLGGPSSNLDALANRRRTVYGTISRHDLAWILRLFDFPDPNITSGGRALTTVPLQQLFVLNSEFMVANARALAARLLAASQSGHADADRVRLAYMILYGRSATDRELKLGLAYLQAPEHRTATTTERSNDLDRWQCYAQALLATNEFLFVD
jgi:hypothetical protein